MIAELNEKFTGHNMFSFKLPNIYLNFKYNRYEAV